MCVDPNDEEATGSVAREVNKAGWAVCLCDSDYSVCLFNAEVCPASTTIKLTKDYDAEVFADKVIVGCQTIPADTLKKVYEKMMELNQ